MKVLHLTLIVGQLDISRLYYRGFLYFAITSRSPSAVEMQSLFLGIPSYTYSHRIFFSCFSSPFDICLKDSTCIKHATKKFWKPLNMFLVSILCIYFTLIFRTEIVFSVCVPTTHSVVEYQRWIPKYSSKLPEPSSSRPSVLLIPPDALKNVFLISSNRIYRWIPLCSHCHG